MLRRGCSGVLAASEADVVIKAGVLFGFQHSVSGVL